MKVLLVSANTLKEPYPVYPLGLDYVAGAIADDHQVTISDMNTLADLFLLAGTLKCYLPDVIGLAMRNSDNNATSDPRGVICQYRESVAVIRRHSVAPTCL